MKIWPHPRRRYRAALGNLKLHISGRKQDFCKQLINTKERKAVAIAPISESTCAHSPGGMADHPERTAQGREPGRELRESCTASEGTPRPVLPTSSAWTVALNASTCSVPITRHTAQGLLNVTSCCQGTAVGGGNGL